MTELEMKAQLQAAQDMFEVLQEQRNSAQNQIVQLGGQIKAQARKIAELEKTVADAALETEPELDLTVPPKPNGHSTHAIS